MTDNNKNNELPVGSSEEDKINYEMDTLESINTNTEIIQRITSKNTQPYNTDKMEFLIDGHYYFITKDEYNLINNMLK